MGCLLTILAPGITEYDIEEYECEADFIEANLDGIESSSICESENLDRRDVAIFIKSTRGKPSLLLNGFKYREIYRTKKGTKWCCSKNKNCPAYLILNDKDEVIVQSCEQHNHDEKHKLVVMNDCDTSAVVITSRKGKEMLLHRQYTYRKQYTRGEKIRWVCSNTKNCHACVFTNMDNFITASYEEHSHDPPKYYLDPEHVLAAIREPIILEAEN